jgi:NADPH:quinone reductase-like Zn-dependent oxidoreductase
MRLSESGQIAKSRGIRLKRQDKLAGALHHGELKAGETLLVLGATGGVGSAAIQLGNALGASVIAVVPKPAPQKSETWELIT